MNLQVGHRVELVEHQEGQSRELVAVEEAFVCSFVCVELPGKRHMPTKDGRWKRRRVN